MNINIPSHSIRFGKTAEVKILQEHEKTFEAVVLNASSLAYFGRFLSEFIFINSAGKHFFVDPQTHAFQHTLDKISNNKGEIKTSMKKLIETYGEPLNKAILNERRPVTPDDFTPQSLRSFVDNLLKFQSSHLFSCLDDDYKEYIMDDEDEDFKDIIPSSPLFLTAPYFYLEYESSRREQWITINRKAVDIARDISGDDKTVFGQLVINIPLLLKLKGGEGVLFKKILDIFQNADGILLWLDDFKEHDVLTKTLKAAVYLVKKLKDEYPDKKIINLYGGYFSQLLMKFGLNGVVHGPEYGESRAVAPVGGGIPIAKFYHPPIKKRIPVTEIWHWLQYMKVTTPELFHEHVCDCIVCKEMITQKVANSFMDSYGKTDKKEIQGRWGVIDREYPKTETVENCLAHYLQVKKKEFDTDRNRDIKVLLEELHETYKRHEKHFGIYYDEKEFCHLKHWVEALKDE